MIPARWFGRRFRVVLADPPWRFETYSDKGKGRSAERHYETMDMRDILNVPVRNVMAEDSVLFLWATAPMLLPALWVMNHWGYQYKTNAVWAKDRFGTGYWLRSQHELLLIGTHGGGLAPKPGNRPSSLISAPRRRHSEKPIAVYDLIEGMVEGPYLELFARKPRAGWATWGNEIS